MIDNPNAPPKVRAITSADAAERVSTGSLVIIDVRPADERAVAALSLPFAHFDHGMKEIEAMDKATPMAFLCHTGARSGDAAEHFRALGFTEVYNISGGIDAWSTFDPAIPRY